MNLANQLTVLRILLVPTLVGLLLYYDAGRPYLYPLILGVFLSACLTDALDGYIARRLAQKTALGSYLDPLADKMLLSMGFLCLSLMQHLPEAMRIPAWVTIPIIARDVLILIGSVMIFLTTGKLKAEPTLTGKATTFLQMMTLLGALAMAPALPQTVLHTLTVAITAASGFQYLRIGERLLQA